MALNPIVFTEKVVRSFLRYQLTAYPKSSETNRADHFDGSRDRKPGSTLPET